MEDLIRKSKEDFILAAKRARLSGIQTGNGGNISVRVPGKDWMAVKASGVSFEESALDSIVVTDFTGKVIEGDLKPTREFVLHASLYQRYPDIGAIVHTHSPYAIAWSFSGRDIPLVTKHTQMKLKNPIPVVLVTTTEVKPENIDLVHAAFAAQPALTAFVLQGHGIVAVGKSAVEAEYSAELVEETAQIAWLQAVGQKIGLLP
ncbi:MAG: class II aldolase/adducin family protein [Negativicutes bacterium]|nr:class II aldolase/adducin family protein [Negativicutes bacterium]